MPLHPALDRPLDGAVDEERLGAAAQLGIGRPTPAPARGRRRARSSRAARPARRARRAGPRAATAASAASGIAEVDARALDGRVAVVRDVGELAAVDANTERRLGGGVAVGKLEQVDLEPRPVEPPPRDLALDRRRRCAAGARGRAAAAVSSLEAAHAGRRGRRRRRARAPRARGSPEQTPSTNAASSTARPSPPNSASIASQLRGPPLEKQRAVEVAAPLRDGQPPAVEPALELLGREQPAAVAEACGRTLNGSVVGLVAERLARAGRRRHRGARSPAARRDRRARRTSDQPYAAPPTANSGLRRASRDPRAAAVTPSPD